jgi:hypothetical protein
MGNYASFPVYHPASRKQIGSVNRRLGTARLITLFNASRFQSAATMSAVGKLPDLKSVNNASPPPLDRQKKPDVAFDYQLATLITCLPSEKKI